MGSLGDHHIQRSNVAKKATKAYKEAIDTYLREGMESIAYMIVNSAHHLRLNNPYAHEFTGNLINSICAGVFFHGKLVYKRFSYEIPGMSAPIQVEMTKSDNEDWRTYVFDNDWEGEESRYSAMVVTNESYGQVHANAFIDSYKPTSNYLEIVLAYTVEYAEFVEKRYHLGYGKAFEDFNEMFVAFQRKIAKGARFANGHTLKYVNVTA